jgi:hypothetical protein
MPGAGVMGARGCGGPCLRRRRRHRHRHCRSGGLHKIEVPGIARSLFLCRCEAAAALHSQQQPGPAAVHPAGAAAGADAGRAAAGVSAAVPHSLPVPQGAMRARSLQPATCKHHSHNQTLHHRLPACLPACLPAHPFAHPACPPPAPPRRQGLGGNIKRFVQQLTGALPVIGLVSRWASTEGGVGDDAQAYPEFSRQVFDAAPVGFQIAVAELQTKYGKVGQGWSGLLACQTACKSVLQGLHSLHGLQAGSSCSGGSCNGILNPFTRCCLAVATAGLVWRARRRPNWAYLPTQPPLPPHSLLRCRRRSGGTCCLCCGWLARGRAYCLGRSLRTRRGACVSRE